jgi:hypothetical protein
VHGEHDCHVRLDGADDAGDIKGSDGRDDLGGRFSGTSHAWERVAEASEDFEARIRRPWSHQPSVLRRMAATDNGTVAFHRQIATFRAAVHVEAPLVTIWLPAIRPQAVSPAGERGTLREMSGCPACGHRNQKRA